LVDGEGFQNASTLDVRGSRLWGPYLRHIGARAAILRTKRWLTAEATRDTGHCGDAKIRCALEKSAICR